MFVAESMMFSWFSPCKLVLIRLVFVGRVTFPLPKDDDLRGDVISFGI